MEAACKPCREEVRAQEKSGDTTKAEDPDLLAGARGTILEGNPGIRYASRVSPGLPHSPKTRSREI